MVRNDDRTVRPIGDTVVRNKRYKLRSEREGDGNGDGEKAVETNGSLEKSADHA